MLIFLPLLRRRADVTPADATYALRRHYADVRLLLSHFIFIAFDAASHYASSSFVFLLFAFRHFAAFFSSCRHCCFRLLMP